MNLKSAIKRSLDPLTLGLVSLPFAGGVVDYFSYQKLRRDRRRIEAALRAKDLYGDVVQFGPFQGMKYPPGWASCRFQKIIGSYEAELHEILARIIDGPEYSSVINAGAAEGYFTVGLGRAMPGAELYSYEIQESPRAFLKEFAELNGLQQKLVIAAGVTPEILAALDPGERPLVVCDVDSYETTLLDPEAVPWLRSADLLVEVHDNMVPGISETLRGRFEATHKIEHVESTGLEYGNYPLLRELTYHEMRIMIEEGRPAIQDWFFMTVQP